MRHRTVKRKRKGIRRILCLLFIVLLLIIVKVFISSIGIFGQSAGMEHGWNLMLVNQDYRVPRNYKVELTELSNGKSVDSRIYPSLQQMFDDMRAQEIYPTVASGDRTSKKQQSLMDEKIESFIAQGYSRSDAATEALKWS
jgi:serine-type D-Ala-D-Ala carboxypeptidase